MRAKPIVMFQIPEGTFGTFTKTDVYHGLWRFQIPEGTFGTRGVLSEVAKAKVSNPRRNVWNLDLLRGRGDPVDVSNPRRNVWNKALRATESEVIGVSNPRRNVWNLCDMPNSSRRFRMFQIPEGTFGTHSMP